MWERFGMGPVFEYEWLTMSRRWQIYAARSLFVALLLAGLGVVWWTEVANRNFMSFSQYASIAASFYNAIVGTQFSMILMVAPAAMAGAVCVEKSRGTLAHMMVTDLTDSEIVLGKLAARLVPVLGFLGCTVPVVALGALLGGIDPVGLAGAYLVMTGLAVLGSTLALTLSVWASKPYEVLVATYSIWAIWILAPWVATSMLGMGSIAWLEEFDPLRLVFVQSRAGGIGPQTEFLGLCLLVSTALAVLAVWKIRPVAVGQGKSLREPEAGSKNPSPSRRTGFVRGRARRLKETWSGPRPSWLRAEFRWWPTPSLDGNPVLWREWHRNRPSRWMRILGAVFALVGVSSTGLVIYGKLRYSSPPFLEPWVTALQTSIGFLLVAVIVSTSLSEERARGSLDVLLATPLSTGEILWGKWWGAYRIVPWLTVLPALLGYVLATEDSTLWMAFYLLIGLILAYGAALTSLGLALATWIARPGRVMSVAIGIHLLVTVGWIFLIMALSPRVDSAQGLMEASSFFGPGMLTALMAEPRQFHNAMGARCLSWAMVWIAVDSLVALALYLAMWVSFDRCLGRVPERPLSQRARWRSTSGAGRRREARSG